MFRLRMGTVVIVGAALSPWAGAQAQFTVQGQVSNSLNGESVGLYTVPGSASLPDGTAVTDSGTWRTLGASAEAVANGDSGYAYVARSVNDWVVSGPTGTTVNAAMNLNLKGTLSDDMWDGSAIGEVWLTVYDITQRNYVIEDTLLFVAAGLGTGTTSYYNISDENGSGGGFSSFVNQAEPNAAAYVAQLQSGVTVFTNPMPWTVGDDYYVQLGLDANAEYVDNNTATAPPDIAQFDDPMTFNPPQVLDLPIGYTLNSPQSGIVNNVLTPEPAPFAALGLGVLGLLSRRRLRKS